MINDYIHPDLRMSIRDDPQRTAPPEVSPEVRDFNDLPLMQRLDSVQRAIKRPVYKLALVEALGESDEYPTWLAQLVDSTVSDADVGRSARDIVCAYIAEVAQRRRDRL
jgi:hypothetical protein